MLNNLFRITKQRQELNQALNPYMRLPVNVKAGRPKKAKAGHSGRREGRVERLSTFLNLHI